MMTGFMFVLFVAMFIGIILMFIIDVHMAKMVDKLSDIVEYLVTWTKDVNK